MVKGVGKKARTVRLIIAVLSFHNLLRICTQSSKSSKRDKFVKSLQNDMAGVRANASN